MNTAETKSTICKSVGNAEVTLADNCSTITGNIDTSDGSVLGAGDTITFTAAISEPEGRLRNDNHSD